MAPHILAVLIFVVMFVLIVMDKIERQYVSLGCGLLMIVLVFGLGMHSKDAIVETLNVKSIFQASFWYTAAEGEASSSGINWSTIIFILGMMIMVEGMGKAGFFRWLCLETVSYTHLVVAVCGKEIQWIQNAFEYRRAGTWNNRRRR